MRLPATLRWIGLALLGLAIAAAVALAAGRLASQQIGIASESISAGDRLAPRIPAAATRHRAGSGDHGAPARTTPEPPPTEPATAESPSETPPAAPTAPAAQGDDYGGGSGGGEGSDD